MTSMGVKSFTKNIGKNFILSLLVSNPKGDEDPVLWSKIRWATTMTMMIRGIRKCRDRNRFRVGCDTEKLPHNHRVIIFPTYGTADSILVMTVAPQKDI